MEHSFHRELKAQVIRFLTLNVFMAYEEIPLPNRKIADIVGVNGSQRIIIVEVKTTLHNESIPEILDKYSAYCHGLYVAAPAPEICRVLSPTPLLHMTVIGQSLGWLAIAPGKMTIARQAANRPMSEQTYDAMRAALHSRITAG